MRLENKADTRRIIQLAGNIQDVLCRRKRIPVENQFHGLTLSDILQIVESASLLSALLLHPDTEIAVMEDYK